MSSIARKDAEMTQDAGAMSAPSCGSAFGGTLSVRVAIDDALLGACAPFDYAFSGESVFTLPRFDAPKRDGSWAIGLIVGPSGSGKTQLLKRHYGLTPAHEWDDKKAIVSHFGTSEKAIELLTAVGLNSVPSWCRPFHVLSNGEQFRAALAAGIGNNTGFDEFTSVVDRTVAKSATHALQRYIRHSAMTGVVFSSCHRDIVDWLLPDWTFDTLTGELSPRGSLRRPGISVEIEPCDRGAWKIFSHHHYMSAELSGTCRAWIARWNSDVVGFVSSMPLPSGTTKNAWREHRTVVLPDYQGLGIGVRISDEVAQIHLDEGRRYYSKTAHPRMGEYRDRSPKWRATKHNRKVAKYQHGTMTSWRARDGVFMYSHEYVGERSA